jgi:hypothetical protein
MNMRMILEKIISEHTSPQGEGLIEFMYAIASQKLTIKQEHLAQLSSQIDEVHTNELVLLFNHFIKENLLKEKPTLQEKIYDLEEEVKRLKEALENPM